MSGHRTADRPRPEDLLVTDRLRQRPGRTIDPAAEAAAFQRLSSLLVRRPASVPARFLEAVRRLCPPAGSVGISELTTDAEGREVLAPAQVSGALTETDVHGLDWRAGPFTHCLQSRRAVLLDRPARLYPDLGRKLPIFEVLVAPLLGRGGKPLGVLWAASHAEAETFGAAEAELLQRLAPLLVLALQMQQGEAARHDLQERVFTTTRLAVEARRLGAIFDQAPGFIAVLRGPNHEFVFANRANRRLIGHNELVGRTVAEVLPQFLEQGFLDMLDEAYRTGKAVVGEGVRANFAPRGAAAREHYLDFVFQPLKARGQVQGIFVEGHDVTSRVVNEERARLISQESSHRVKNTLATVQAIAAHTARTSADLPAFFEAFEARLISLAKTNDLMIAHAWSGAPLAEVLAVELELFIDKCAVEGPPVMLSPSEATAMGMIAHELVTNSSKYGAFSTPTGQVRVEWRRRSERSGLHLLWRETGGPSVQAPAEVGFGTRLIQRLVVRELNGACAFTFHPEGLVCEIRANLARAKA